MLCHPRDKGRSLQKFGLRGFELTIHGYTTRTFCYDTQMKFFRRMTTSWTLLYYSCTRILWTSSTKSLCKRSRGGPRKVEVVALTRPNNVVNCSLSALGANHNSRAPKSHCPPSAKAGEMNPPRTTLCPGYSHVTAFSPGLSSPKSKLKPTHPGPVEGDNDNPTITTTTTVEGGEGTQEGEESESEYEEEIEYVTLDLGNIEPTLVPSSHTYRLIVRSILPRFE